MSDDLELDEDGHSGGCTLQYPCMQCKRSPPPPNNKLCCARLLNGWHCMLDEGHDGDHRSPPVRELSTTSFFPKAHKKGNTP